MTAISTLISAGGGGGGSEVNDQKFINSAANLITTESGEKWLKSGVTETSVSDYPNANVAITSIANGNSNFVLASAPRGIVAIGSDIWILYAASMQKFANTGGSALITISTLGGSETNARALSYDGTYLYVVGDQYNSVARYTTAGIYTSTFFSTNPSGSPRSAAWDGTHFHVSQYSNSTVYKITAAGVYSGQSYTVQHSGCFLTVADGYIYAMRPDSTIDKYSTSGTYINTLSPSSFVSGVTNNNSTNAHSGITYDGSNFWICVLNNERAYKFTTGKAVGVSSSITEAGSPLYSRIL